MLNELPALFGQAVIPSENRLGRSGAQANNNFRPDQRHLGFEPRAACARFRSARLLVNPAFPPLFELEMFNGVGEVHRRSIDARVLQGAIQ